MTTVDPSPGHDDHGGCGKNHCHSDKRGEEGGVCHQAAGWGTDHVGIGACKLHGGNTPSHKTAARVEQARQAAATYGLSREIEPAAALLEELHRTAGAVTWLGSIIAAMDREDLVWGIVEESDSTGEHGGSTTKRKAAKSVWVQLYQEERKHLAAVARDALGADAAGRMTAVWEQMGSAFDQLLTRVMDRIELTAEQRAAIPGVIVEELQALPGGTP